LKAHILEQLLAKGHQVVTTVRSEEKADQIRKAYSSLGEDKLKVVAVGDIAKEGAFDEVVKEPGLEVVLHTASPFHYNVSHGSELVKPALVGTTGILRAIARSAPQVRRVVVTSSFAAILDEAHMTDPDTTFTEDSWNPVAEADLEKSHATAYRVSKKFAEKAAWDFVADKANGAKFDVVTINPPLVLGPVVHHLKSLASINTSNERIAAAVTGKWKEAGAVADTGIAVSWIDVRDCAEAHVLAGLELPEAGGKRLFTTEGHFCNRDIYDAVWKNFPDLRDRLPPPEAKGGEMPEKHYKVDNSKTAKLLGIKWIPLEKSVVDAVNNFRELGA
jgi:nucleoside-diphosphate-sugar epimerase